MSQKPKRFVYLTDFATMSVNEILVFNYEVNICSSGAKFNQATLLHGNTFKFHINHALK